MIALLMNRTLQIKNFPDWLRRWLKIKAAEREITLQQYVIELVIKAHNGNGKC